VGAARDGVALFQGRALREAGRGGELWWWPAAARRWLCLCQELLARFVAAEVLELLADDIRDIFEGMQ